MLEPKGTELGFITNSIHPKRRYSSLGAHNSSPLGLKSCRGGGGHNTPPSSPKMPC